MTYQPKYLHTYLETIGAKPRKSSSQNFLIDQNIGEKVLAEACVTKGDKILEIGPGPGALTHLFLKAKADVIAIEIDKKLAAGLKEQDLKGLTLIEADALKFPYESLPNPPYKVISNLPYQITSPIIGKLIDHRHLFSQIVVFVQEEVGQRICASPKTKTWGAFSLFVQFYCDVNYCFKVSKNCFWPTPKVDSAIVSLTPKKELPLEDPSPFFELVKIAFNQRRKMVKSTLSKKFGEQELLDSLNKANIAPTSRPEELSIHQWIQLFQSLTRSNYP